MTVGIPGILLVLDGWGHADESEANALAAASTPYLDRLLATCPTVLADASGSAVGLLPGTVGNSEIGHMVIGAGRPIPYDSLLVHEEISSGRMGSNETLTDVLTQLSETGGTLHLIGLCSDGMIHADVRHLRELLRIAARFAVPQVHIHAVTDGRDVADGTAAVYLDLVDTFVSEAGIGQVVTVVGRGYALDKSGRRDLTEKVALAVVDGKGEMIGEPRDALALTDRGDEWVPPCVVIGAGGAPPGGVRDGDAVLFTNFRSDRIQQLADDLYQRLSGRPVAFLSLAQYDTQAPVPPLVHRSDASGGLAAELASHGVRSVRVSEAEKFEHVTYYINGRDATVVPVEEYVKVTGDTTPDYTTRPAMNIDRVAEAVVTAAGRDDVSLVIANLANIDVVGHTGDFDATRLAAEHTDRAVEAICRTAQSAGRWVLLVGDHGNAEKMLTETGKPYGGHTTNPVPAVLVPVPGQQVATSPESATLADIAPSVLGLLGIAPASRMTGRRLW
ncbi:2,3-bisphosphoglycerate-independent phosphoglycerate mutase [Streptomyces sp. RB110-1]|uniref:2,3-bisphosphoglycerate-independent phosphoglycerate mutase n=1 Tax=unclassified Streptomyces TaxID=2593676 RepID=UPI0018FF6296|nr:MULTISPECIES: 2,3-bisphosphoglycerate-independent phosphoglycerate mutase [unclassified Streptomyces]MBK0372959.1 2,3-bisphosphoglycerate-independent phosphoglycerate mutase [Streptomyces sp. RB110-1]MBK0390673.1 2,3-bisphosphoglycerate-independent phosphoglycerate mutase [Streptomyces sp. RB110-2]